MHADADSRLQRAARAGDYIGTVGCRDRVGAVHGRAEMAGPWRVARSGTSNRRPAGGGHGASGNAPPAAARGDQRAVRVRGDGCERREIGRGLRARPGERQRSDIRSHQRGDHHERAQSQPDEGGRAALERSLGCGSPRTPVTGHGPAGCGGGPGSRNATPSARTVTGGTPNSSRTPSSTLTRTRSGPAATTVTRATRPAGSAARAADTARTSSAPSAASLAPSRAAPCART